jgi:mannan endo-1,4-beta-mannosidase
VAVHGLIGEYFKNATLTAPSVFTELDPDIHDTWGSAASPDPRIPVGSFSIRWTGKLHAAYNQSYKLTAHSGDGVRVFIDGVKVVDDWTAHQDRDATGNVTLTNTRPHDIVVEYFFVTGWAVMRLSWESASQASEIIPTTAYTPN